MKTCNDEFLRDPYPYSSEIEIDETGQHQVYFFSRLFAGLGSAESKKRKEDLAEDPGVFGYEPPRTFEGGPGLWGYLRAAKAYVVEDPTFGWIGYGCRLETTADEIKAFPNDGVKKRVRFVSDRIDIEASAGEIISASFNRKAGSLGLEITDSTGLVKTARLAVQGLRPGDYREEFEGGAERRSVKDTLNIELPIDRARAISIKKL